MVTEISFDEAAVAAAWDRNADQWTSDVQAGFDLYRVLYTLPAYLSFIPVIPFEVPRFPRTLSDYINAVADAGFRITRTDEPRPDAKLSEDHPWLARWHAHAPLVLFVEAKKEPTRSRVEGRTGRRLIAPGSAAKEGAANESAHRPESMQGEVDRGTLATSAMKQFPKTRARLAK